MIDCKEAKAIIKIINCILELLL